MTKSILNVNGDEMRHASEDIDTQGGINDKFSMLKIHSDGTTKFVGSFKSLLFFSLKANHFRPCFWLLNLLAARFKMDLRSNGKQ